MPGQEKIFSTSTAPVSTFANTRPSTVIDRRQRRAQDVPDDDDPLGQPLRARGADVVVPDHLEHGRAREAGEQADVERRRARAPAGQVVERVPNVDHWPGEQRVDRVEAGDVRRRRHARDRAARRPGTSRAGRRRRRARSARARTSASRCPRARRRAARGRSGGCGAAPRRRRARRRRRPRTGSRERELGRRRDELAPGRA